MILSELSIEFAPNFPAFSTWPVIVSKHGWFFERQKMANYSMCGNFSNCETHWNFWRKRKFCYNCTIHNFSSAVGVKIFNFFFTLNSWRWLPRILDAYIFLHSVFFVHSALLSMASMSMQTILIFSPNCLKRNEQIIVKLSQRQLKNNWIFLSGW